MPEDPRNAGPLLIVAVHRAVGRFVRRQDSLVRRIGALEEEADRFRADLVGFLEWLAEAPANGAGRSPKRGRRHADAIKLRTLTAAAGAASLSAEALPSGKYSVRVNGGDAFELPPLLGDLLTILASDTGRSDDEFVPFKTRQSVIKKLAGLTGAPMEFRTLNQAVYRLRAELLERGKVNPDYVQVNRRRGMRFALRTGGASVAAAASLGLTQKSQLHFSQPALS
jgi:hypothetical protein